jgi:hypothetical protein
MHKNRQLPKIRTLSYPDRDKHVLPFSRVKQEMGELSFHVNTESTDFWANNSAYHPMGMKSYDLVSMTEIKKHQKSANNDHKHNYKKVIINNPQVFYKRTGEFTTYINSAIKFNKIGPFNKKK